MNNKKTNKCVYALDTDRLSLAMRKNGKKKCQIAGECGLTGATISYALSGGDIRSSTLVAIAKALNVSAGWLLGEGSEERENDGALMTPDIFSETIQTFRSQLTEKDRQIEMLLNLLGANDCSIIKQTDYENKETQNLQGTN